MTWKSWFKIFLYPVLGFSRAGPFVLYFAVSQNYLILTMNNASMKPTLRKGDLVLLDTKKAGRIEPGDGGYGPVLENRKNQERGLYRRTTGNALKGLLISATAG